MKSRWSDEEASGFLARYAGEWGEDLAMRTYAGRLLGAETDLVLHGGGNTSVKTTFVDILGRPRRALYVKASGLDLAAIDPEGHTGLDLGELERFRDLEELPDSLMRAELRTRVLRASSPDPSIEALAHAFLPKKFIDHTHADAILALTNQPDGERLVHAALGSEILVLGYVRPGFPLAKAAAALFEAQPGGRGMVWARHGLVTWGDTARESYETMIALVTRAEEFLERRGSARRKRATPGRREAPDERRDDAQERLGVVPVHQDARAREQESAPTQPRSADGLSPQSSSTTLETATAHAARIAPILRGLLASPSGDPDRPHRTVILRPLINRDILDFVDSEQGRALALTAPLTTDHLIRTKTVPLWIEHPRYDDEAALREQLAGAVSEYAASYAAYLARHGARMPDGLVPFDPLPRVVLMPGLGAFCSGESAAAAGIVRDITEHTLRVKSKVAAMGSYEGLSEAHLFEMEYHALQHAKLGGRDTVLRRDDAVRRVRDGAASVEWRDPAPGGARAGTAGGGRGHAPVGGRAADTVGASGPSAHGALGPSSLAGRIALVTGAAGAIGSGICRVLLEQACHVAVTDLTGEALDRLVDELRAEFGEQVLGVPLDVTDAVSVARGFETLFRTWGGVDLVVINAGAALVSPLSAIDVEAFRRLARVNVEGALLLLGEAARQFERQATGGDVVLISSKNVFAPGASFGAYSATKAAAHQLARVASLEMAPLGVRVNMVAPDAVFSEGARRSGLWAEVGPERMRARGLGEKDLEEYYRTRNLLKARITARHVARAVLFFATRQTPTTGATLPVDGGLPDATPR